MKAKQTVTYTIPLFPIFVTLLVLKLLGVISIGWIWVFMPLLIVPITFVAVLLFMAALALIGGIIAAILSAF